MTLSSVWPGFVAGERLSTLVERLPDLSKFPAKIHALYHWGSWTWYMIFMCVISGLKYSILTVHDHWEQQNEPLQLSWPYLMYLARWGSNYTWIWMYLLDQFAENFVHLWNHALVGAYINHFTVFRSSLWSCEIMYHTLPTFLHLYHVWIVAIPFSKCIALLSTNTKACQGVVRDSQPYIHITISSCSLASHTLRREEGSCHAATIELSSRQKLDVTNQICALRRSHLLSWSTIMLHV